MPTCKSTRDIKADDLISRLTWALALTKKDAERLGAVYGDQATCVKAIKLAAKYLDLKVE